MAAILSPVNNVEREKPDTKHGILYDSLDIKPKNRQN